MPLTGKLSSRTDKRASAKLSNGKLLPKRQPPPDFVIVGAPKAGTTALFEALAQHPSVSGSVIKEPNYFALDYPKLRQVRDRYTYDRLFARAAASQLRGEASVHYISSTNAIPAILNCRSDAKFIVMVRDPISMFISWHNELLKWWAEDEPNIEVAWRLQTQRQNGRRIPKWCKEPALLQYRKICDLGWQIDRMFSLVPARQRLAVVYDDLCSDPIGVYQRVLAFLELRDDGRRNLDFTNVFARFSNPLVPMLGYAMASSSLLSRVGVMAKLLDVRVPPVHWWTRKALMPRNRPTLTRPFAKELTAEFSPGVRLLGDLLNRDLTRWLEPPLPSEGSKELSEMATDRRERKVSLE